MLTEILSSLVFLAVILVLRWFGVIPRVDVWRPRWYQRLRLWMRLRRIKRLENQPAWKRRQPRPRWAIWAMVGLVSVLAVRILALRWHPSLETAQADQPKQPVAQPAPQPAAKPQPTQFSWDELQEQPPEPDYGAVGNSLDLEIESTKNTPTTYISQVRICPPFTEPRYFQLECDRKRSDCDRLYPGGAITFRLLRPRDSREYQNYAASLISKKSTSPDMPPHEIYGLIDSEGVLTKWIAEAMKEATKGPQ